MQRSSHGHWVVADTQRSDPTYAPFGRWTTFQALPPFAGSKTFAHGHGAYRVLEQLQWIRPTARVIANPPIDGTVSTVLRHYHYPYPTGSARHSCRNRAPTSDGLPAWDVAAGVQSTKTLSISDPDGDKPLHVHVRNATEGSKKLIGFATVDGRHLQVDPSPDEVGTVSVTYDVTDPAGAVSKPSTLQVNVGNPAHRPTTAAVSASANPVVTGQAVTFTVTVAASAPTPPGTADPGGTVAFRAGGSDLAGCGAVPISAGTAQCVVANGFPASSQIITAIYSGDASFNGSQASLTETVNVAATTVGVATSANPLVTGQPVTFTAAVTAVAPGHGTPTGTVAFTSDGTALPGCSATVVTSGFASCGVTNGFLAGTHHIVAFYSGDSSFAAADNSTSTLAEQVNPAATTTTLSANNNPAVNGQSVTFTATVTVSAPGTMSAGGPGGTVKFQSGGSDIAGCGAVPISASTAQCVVAGGFPVSSQTIAATYVGDTNFGGSQAAALTETVTADPTTVTVSSSEDPTTFTATVTSTPPGSGMPTGSVTFTVTDSSGATPTCMSGSNTVPLVNGSASCTIDDSTLMLTPPYTVSASYSGDANFSPSTGNFP